MKETWNTDNQLTSEIIVKDPYAKGLLVKGESTFSPLSRKRTLKATAEYLSEALALHAQLDGSSAPFLFRLGAVFGYDKLLFGYEAGINVNNQSFTYNHIALGYRTENLELHSFAKAYFRNNNSEFGGTAFQRVNKNVEVGTMVGWTIGEPGATFGLGTRMKFDNGRVLQAKISSKSELGLCLREKIYNGIFSSCDLHKTFITFYSLFSNLFHRY
ncbi:Porin 3 domain containing protein [Trichuris trichiura]|uniref:Porin 3 domain containing protein n=1 Tax=Trichuris trichiura TaxID=36087 RepID=A0A077Z742_TRITR|nr:Porin 3 domain containing protein [Trichuris trichiura]